MLQQDLLENKRKSSSYITATESTPVEGEKNK